MNQHENIVPTSWTNRTLTCRFSSEVEREDSGAKAYSQNPVYIMSPNTLKEYIYNVKGK